MQTVELSHLFATSGTNVTQEQVSNMCDNLVVLGFHEGPNRELNRRVRILKTRGSSHDEREHTLEIGGRGAVITKAK